MPSINVLHLVALAAVAAILLQLPARLAGLVEVVDPILTPMALIPFIVGPGLALSPWSRSSSVLPTVAAYVTFSMVGAVLLVLDSGLQNLGRFAEFVDQLLCDEDRRSALEPEIFKLRTKYKNQHATVTSLGHDITEVRKEQHRRCRDIPSALWPPRRRLEITAANIPDIDWTEPHLLVKMCK